MDISFSHAIHKEDGFDLNICYFIIKIKKRRKERYHHDISLFKWVGYCEFHRGNRWKEEKTVSTYLNVRVKLKNKDGFFIFKRE